MRETTAARLPPALSPPTAMRLGSPPSAAALAATQRVAAYASSPEAGEGGRLLEEHRGRGIARHGALRSAHAAEYRQGEVLVNAFEGHLAGGPDAEAARRPVVQEGREAEARVVLQRAERGDEGHAVLVAGEECPVHGHPREEPPAPAY